MEQEGMLWKCNCGRLSSVQKRQYSPGHAFAQSRGMRVFSFGDVAMTV